MIRPRRPATSRRTMFALAALMASATLLTGCSRPPDEEIIRGHLEAMTTALAEGNPRAFVDPLAADFTTVHRGLDRSGARMLARRELLARERVRVRLIDIDVEHRGDDRAVARFNALATGGSGLLPSEGRLWRVETGWRRDGGDWQMISAQWEPVIGR